MLNDSGRVIHGINPWNMNICMYCTCDARASNAKGRLAADLSSDEGNTIVFSQPPYTNAIAPKKSVRRVWIAWYTYP
jgi:hypothetical protein